LSMVEWNMILGSMPPSSDAEWQIPFEKYKESPEYQIINNQFTLDEFKSIYWWEYIHRFLGRTIGVVFLIPFFYFWLKKKFGKPILRKMFVLLALGALQGFLGWFMVKSGLQKEPHVSHFRLAIHLISAFTVFGFTFWYALDLMYPQKNELTAETKKVLRFAKFMFAFIVIQIIYGAFVAGLKAGLFYNTFPKMGETYFPDTIYSYDTFIQNISENPSGVQFVHRYIAYLVVILIALVWNKANKLQLSTLQKKAANYLLGMVLVQFLLGVITIMMTVPVLMGVLHQTGAFFLFASGLFFIHSLRTAS
jgi:heme a synthase